MRSLISLVFLALALPLASSQTADLVDSDRDGLSDSLESALLAQFAPQFLVSSKDCSLRPAEFVPLVNKPTIQAENGVIYGQAFPHPGHAGQVELHFYHLWRTDCGDMGHGLDAEHVSALVSRNDDASWKALDWYAAAHEDTVCDGSQITRAATIQAEQHGPQVWISRGKHASFLNSDLCSHGCGGDQCRNLEPLPTAAVINLGEPSAPVNGATWANDPHWPLAAKMRRTDFTDARLARLSQLPDTAIAWANPPKRGYQPTIRVAGSTADGIGTGARATGTALTATDVALDTANAKTGNALADATNATGHGLGKTYKGVVKALHTSANKVGSALGARSAKEESK